VTSVFCKWAWLHSCLLYTTREHGWVRFDPGAGSEPGGVYVQQQPRQHCAAAHRRPGPHARRDSAHDIHEKFSTG